MDRFQIETLTQTKYIFFTGKGGVGKTSIAAATAIALADQGKDVLLVSTDPASNLQDVFQTGINEEITSIPNVSHLKALNLDPEKAAHAYKEKVVGPYRGKLPQAAIEQMEEQLSGACTVEMAAFDEFTTILSESASTEGFDHILFDTAPTGHTLRLLQLPSAWSGFLEHNTHGASCLGPLSGVKEKAAQYEETVKLLSNPDYTSLMLIARPNASSLYEAGRAADELQDLNIDNQKLIINGVHPGNENGDPIAQAYIEKQQKHLATLPPGLQKLPTYSLPLFAQSLTGVDGLRQLFQTDEENDQPVSSISLSTNETEDLASLDTYIDEQAQKGKGIIFTMGKGGVGKTTMAAEIAKGLAERGHHVHLTTTDPAEHLSLLFEKGSSFDHLTISAIDPKQEVENYRQHVLAKVEDDLDEDSLAYIKEDLESPCTEEIAVFQAFANVVDQADDQFVVVDTAPTGHTLLLLDAAESYHQEVLRSTGELPASVKRLIPRLRDPEFTSVAIVTLPEATPVLEAERLETDLIRADITPDWWIINQSFLATETNDPILLGRARAEIEWIQHVVKKTDHTALVDVDFSNDAIVNS